MERGTDPSSRRPSRRPASSRRSGRRLAVGVASVEALLAAAGAVVSVLSGLRGGSLPLAVAVGVVSAGVAYLLAEAARGFARGRRWPTGIFATVQVLVVLVALSLGGPALLTAAQNPRIAVVTVLALALAAAGLWAVVMLAAERPDGQPAGGSPPG